MMWIPGGWRRGHPDDSEPRSDGVVDVISSRLRSPPWLARASAVGLCVVSLAFVALLVGSFVISGMLAIVTEPLPLRLAPLLTPVIAVFALGTLVGAVIAWREGYWSLAARIHQTILAILGVLFVWQLAAFGFLPPG